MRTILDKYRGIVAREGETGGAAGGAAGAGAAGAAGAGAGAAGAAGGAAAGAGAASGAGAGAAGAGGAAAGGGAGAGDPWYRPFNLEQPSIDYLNGKGVKDIGGLIKQAQDFEKVARDRNVIAKPDTSDPAKLAEWEGWEQLGWSKDRAKYAPKEPTRKDGQVYDPTMFKDFVDAAHEARMPVAAVEKIYQTMFDKMQARITEMTTAEKTRADKAKGDLDKKLHDDWGPDFDKRSERSQRFMRAAGIGKEDASELEKVIGSPRLVALFDKFGELIGEDTLKGLGEDHGAQGMSPDQARTERLKLEADPKWLEIFRDQRNPLHAEYTKQRQKLIAIEASRPKPKAT